MLPEEWAAVEAVVQAYIDDGFVDAIVLDLARVALGIAQDEPAAVGG